VTRPVEVVVVAFHGPDMLARCLEVVQGRFGTTVVDNSSDVAVRSAAEDALARYLDPGRNVGFAAGVNHALRPILKGPKVDVLLLNPDAVIEPEDVARLSRSLHRVGGERLAAIAPRLVGVDGTPERAFWPFPSPLRAMLDAAGLGRLWSRSGFAVGAVLLLRWEALLEVGLFDERFFLYAEEADWQRRARRLGWRSEIVGGAVALHVGAASSVDEDRREALFHAAQETYIRKWYGSFGWAVYRWAAFVGAAARAIVLNGRRRRAAAQRARLYARGPRRAASFPKSA
jgi:GT2 family glycosyltransferase